MYSTEFTTQEKIYALLRMLEKHFTFTEVRQFLQELIFKIEDDKINIKDIKQTVTSIADGGENVLTFTFSDGSTYNYTVKNGQKGSKGEKGDKGDSYIITENDYRKIADLAISDIPVATTVVNGLMSKEDKTKLNAIGDTINNKQYALTAGHNVYIDNNIINVGGGDDNEVGGTYNFTIGSKNIVPNTTDSDNSTEENGTWICDAFAQGWNNTVKGNRASAMGFQNKAYGRASQAQGENATSRGWASHAEGRNTQANGEESHAEGYATLASGAASHAEGGDTVSSGERSHAEGSNTKATGPNSHAEGAGGTTASGEHSHAEGWNTKASGHKAHAEGEESIASGECAHAEGWHTEASGKHAHAEGAVTKAQGENSHAEGSDTIASGVNSHAEGAGGTMASGEHSHAEGWNNKAVGNKSHVEGENNTAHGELVHIEGYRNEDLKHVFTSAYPKAAHIEGISNHVYNNAEHAEGTYNSSHIYSYDNLGEIRPTIHSIGIGSSDSYRRNAFEVNSRGDLFVYGVNSYDGTNPYVSHSLQNFLNEQSYSVSAISNRCDTVEAIAKGRATGYVFDTKEDLDAWLEVEENVTKLMLGDNLYIRATDVPDYWWDGETIQQLETQKVDLSEYATEEWVEGKDYLTEHQDLTDYVKNTDYATDNTAGIGIFSIIHGLYVNEKGEVSVNKATDYDIDNKTHNHRPIVPANLDLAVKVGVTTNTIELTEGEKTAAKKWLGVNETEIDSTLDPSTADNKHAAGALVTAQKLSELEKKLGNFSFDAEKNVLTIGGKKYLLNEYIEKNPDFIVYGEWIVGNITGVPSTIPSSGGTYQLKCTASRTRKQHYTDGTTTDMPSETINVSSFSVISGNATINNNTLTVPNSYTAQSIVVEATYEGKTNNTTFTQSAPALYAYYGFSTNEPTEPTSGTPKELTHNTQITISTNSTNKARYHWVSFPTSSGANVSTWLDVDNENQLDITQTKEIGEYTICFLKSSGYITNTSKITINK